MGDSFDAELQRVLSLTSPQTGAGSPVSEKTPSPTSNKEPLLQADSQTPTLKAGKKIFNCSWVGCPRTFKKRDHMHSHLRQHTGETPYTCPVAQCSLKFKWRSSLRNHLRYHEPLESSPIRTPPSSRETPREKRLPPSLEIGPSLADAGSTPPTSPPRKRKCSVTADLPPASRKRSIDALLPTNLRDLLTADIAESQPDDSGRCFVPPMSEDNMFPLYDKIDMRRQLANPSSQPHSLDAAIAEIEGVLQNPDFIGRT